MVYRWPSCRFVAFDIESTGLNRKRDRIIQYGIYGTDSDGSVITKTSIVDSESPTGRDPRNIPGLNPEDFYDIVPIRDGHLDLFDKIFTDAVVIMHNWHHDWGILQSEFERHNRPPPVPKAICCTLDICKHRIKHPTPHTLSALCKWYAVPLSTAHHAWHDANATFWLCIALANTHHEKVYKLLGNHWRTNSMHFPPKHKTWSFNNVISVGTNRLPDLLHLQCAPKTRHQTRLTFQKSRRRS